MSIELVMPSNHLILCRPLLLLPSIFPSIRVFPNEVALRIRWPKYWMIGHNTGRLPEGRGGFGQLCSAEGRACAGEALLGQRG